MKAIIVTCPHCGARLKVDGTLVDLRCEYCGTSSRIQKRSRVLERVLPPPPERPNAPHAIAVQRRRWIVPIAVTLMLVPVSIGVWISARAHQLSRPTTSGPGGTTHITPYSPPPRPVEPSSWLGTDSAILVDLTGDGVLDIIGRARHSSPDAITIVAIDGASGKRRWESASLGAYSDVYVHPLALAGDLFVFASSRGEVRAFSSADGTPRWTTKLDERVKVFCDGGDHVIAVGADDVERPLRRTDGARGAPAEKPPAGKQPKAARPACSELPADKANPTWNHRDRELGRNHDLDLDRLRVGPSGRVLSGTRRKGTHVPTLVAIDDANKQRWRAEVPIDPLAAVERAPGQVVVGAEVVCAVYELTGDERRIAASCFAATDGTRLWHAPLSSHYASALLISGDVLLVSMSGVLEARDLRSGAVRWRFDE